MSDGMFGKDSRFMKHMRTFVDASAPKNPASSPAAMQEALKAMHVPAPETDKQAPSVG